ncbi:MAG: GDSL-type esterase/lipase family protein, partial [Actinomycetia bacterium]|nr:GDSL-type esterase/lipase family protein [Actinomycetes bacterium]
EKAVEDFAIELKIPENTVFISSNNNEILENTNGTLAFKIGNVEGNEKGALYFVVEVKKPLDSDTLIKLDGVKFYYKIGEDIFDDYISTDLVSKIESSPDLNNFKLEAIDENGGVLRLGDIIKYKLVVENTGDMNTAGIEIKSNLSEYVDIIEDSITKSGEYKDNYVLWKIDNIEINKPETFSFKATVKDNLSGEELITNESTLKYGSNIIEKSVEEKLSLFSDLNTSEAYLYDANGGHLWPGETINVRIIIRNTGEKTERGYRVICPIPAGATYISKSGTAEGISWSDDIRGLIWDLKELEIGEEKEITFKMKANENLVNSGGVITIHFKIESSNGEIELPSKSMNVRGNVNMTIVAMGDSLIARSNWVQTFDELLEANYPYADYNTIASAKSGEMARDGNARFDSDVTVHNPDIVIIAYGTNDVGPRFSGFGANLEGIVIKAKSLGARVFINLIGPISWHEKEKYAEYNNEIRQIAAKHGAVVIDVLTPLSQNPGGYLSDGVHYSSEGASVVAHTVFSYVSQYLGGIGQRL